MLVTGFGDAEKGGETLINLDMIGRIHFVGIGGAGMSGIAKVLIEMGHPVSGSDINDSETVHKLQAIGAKIFIGHRKENVEGAAAIVTSTAITKANPEVIAAQEKTIPIFHRSDMVAALMQAKYGIAVAGAHGKTTTTSMVAIALEHAGISPTVLVGGELDFLHGNAKLGTGEHLVAEADESDGSFLKFSPRIAIVTNIENDHMDYYQTMENMLGAFSKFLKKLPSNGLAVLCFDNANVRQVSQDLDAPVISYGLDYPADVTATNITSRGATTRFDVIFQGANLGTVELQVPGRHNVLNSLAAIAVGLHLGLAFQSIAAGLLLFKGAKRRFQTKGRVDGVWIVDDYAHHPTEITTTLLAARDTDPKRLICIFQPHRYTRTQLLRAEFGRAFYPADVLVLTDIYAASEDPIPGISGETLKDEVESQTKQRVTYIADKNKIARYLAEIVESGDLVMTMGAGNVYQIGEELLETLTDR
ncbi:UDP-N-acetylmuramate--L-alanine ligase [Acetonema longum DSM 6540]|uniref:UDP-N-acetylmuramate--L-alanine ligase n=2 Tax=Acetonema TaxID=2373 RepID=F7NMZ3_9FIRM|nr:UDP-N-acetylmuramate--L-alanine ligase [Acetonema longum DSM 6540]